jgi:hypothetical protein
VEELDPGRTEDGEDAVVASMEAAVLHEGLARLSSRHREILLLREFEGWSYRRIASHYRLTLAAVETLLWRARRALHRELTQSGYERRALVGIPVVGWMYRRLGSMKVRLAEWGGSRLAPLIGGAASAVTIGCLVLGGVGSAGHPGRPVTVSSRPSTAGAPARTSAPQPSTAAQVPAATTAGGAAGGGDPAKGPAGPAGGGRAVLGASFSDAGSASQQARQQPVHASGVGVAVGVDPKAATSDLIRQTTGLTQLPRSVP